MSEKNKHLLLFGGIAAAGIAVLWLLTRSGKTGTAIPATSSDDTTVPEYPTTNLTLPTLDTTPAEIPQFNFPLFPVATTEKPTAATAVPCKECECGGFGGVATQTVSGAVLERQQNNLMSSRGSAGSVYPQTETYHIGSTITQNQQEYNLLEMAYGGSLQ